MIIQIRQGQFETNSSSAHSICISDKKEWEEVNYKNMDCVIICSYFGEQDNDFDTFENKASYLATYIVDHAECDEKYSTKLKEIIKDFTGAKKVIFAKDCDGWSGIEERSLNYPEDILKSGDDVIKNFLFNKKSILTTQSDHYLGDNYYDKVGVHYIKGE